MAQTHTRRASLPSEDRAFVALQKAADKLAVQAEQLLKSNGLTGAQYNVLRILRGAEPDGLPCSSIGERMISHDPDMTRLLDRMEKRSLITRQRQSDDRRVVKTRITTGGLELLKRKLRLWRICLMTYASKRRREEFAVAARAKVCVHLR